MGIEFGAFNKIGVSDETSQSLRDGGGTNIPASQRGGGKN